MLKRSGKSYNPGNWSFRLTYGVSKVKRNKGLIRALDVGNN